MKRPVDLAEKRACSIRVARCFQRVNTDQAETPRYALPVLRG
jgi:hypothetical protein